MKISKDVRDKILAQAEEERVLSYDIPMLSLAKLEEILNALTAEDEVIICPACQASIGKDVWSDTPKPLTAKDENQYDPTIYYGKGKDPREVAAEDD